jgi:hypothetical protein
LVGWIVVQARAHRQWTISKSTKEFEMAGRHSLSRSNVQSLLKRRLTDGEDVLFEEADINKDGRLDLDEFNDFRHPG